jgi:hypothetical protein
MLITSAKQKGSSGEYDTEFSLKSIFPDIRALEKRGQPLGFDLLSDNKEAVFECKFHRTITWNELEGYYEKLIENTPTAKLRFVIYKTNRQPVLVFFWDDAGYCIRTFKDVFGVPFQKRPKGYGRMK